MTKENKGITLIALIVTIIILVILTAISISLFSEHGLIEQAKMSKFATEFREIEERVELYVGNSQIEALKQGNGLFNIVLPVGEKLSDEEKSLLKIEKQELRMKMFELTNKSIDNLNLYWIDQGKIGTDKKQRYLIDIETRQIYQYEGQNIFGDMWHTLHEPSSIENGEKLPEIWEGWIRLTLYYPQGSTDRQWRLGAEGESRYDANLMWQEYTQPIWVRLSDVENVWIRYKMNGTTTTIPPAGRVLVDIEPDSYYPTMVNSVNVQIHYDADATIKEYKIGNSGWQTYNGSFTVTSNTIIEARAKKIETISDSEGNIVATREVWGRDNVYVGNINVPEQTTLEAPTIQRNPADGGTPNEVAKVQIIYPSDAVNKVYEINYGQQQNYTKDISVTKYGTHIIAYYYDSGGRRSNSAQILINEETTEQEAYTPNPPGPPATDAQGAPTKPSYAIEAPIITSTPEAVANSVQVSISVPSGNTSRALYYKIGDGSYSLYTGSFNVTSNTVIRAYYITTNGEISDTAVKRINNIKVGNLPYVAIQILPDPAIVKYGQTSVNLEVLSQDATTVEYSLDGIVYQPYTSVIQITNNCRVYARATNDYGTQVVYADITNIGTSTGEIGGTASGGTTSQPEESPSNPGNSSSNSGGGILAGGPNIPTNLGITIQADPEPILSTGLVNDVRISITYDSQATNKYYKIGENGTLQNYTAPFVISQNCTIYAYATGNNAKGSAQKQIDNIIAGISSPNIVSNPTSLNQASSVEITINYDRYATIKRYKIDSGSYVDYTGPITIDKNCTITAYNQNGRGDTANSTYTVNNIIPPSTTVLIDKGKYYILKLAYPTNATGKEYKWQDNGIWTSYKEDGIMLIKPEYKDDILNASGQIIIKIEDENGEKVNFSGDYYFITSSLQELMEHVHMRWDRLTPKTPEIILNTEQPAKQVQASIVYDDILLIRQYKVTNPDGSTQGWQLYDGPVTITENGAIIQARGYDESEVWSNIVTKVVTNIDENPPQIKVTADLTNEKKKVGIKIDVVDDFIVEEVKWVKGIQSESYFQNAGNVIANNSVFYATQNGYYTIYAKDSVGNTSTYTLQVENVDLVPPSINIEVTPTNTTTQIYINIDYGDSTVKQYKIGTSNTTWSNYTGQVSLTSYTVLSNGWKNSDNTVTIYAKGKDSAGNEQIETLDILNLDLDKPSTPVISSNYGYPVISEYGVGPNGYTSIKFDNRSDIDNYYSINNGVTWNVYNGPFNVTGAGTIMAKSVKRNSGLYTTASKTITYPADAVPAVTYDNNANTYTTINHPNSDGRTSKRIYVDSSMWGKKVNIQAYIWSDYSGDFHSNYIYFCNSSGTSLSTLGFAGHETGTGDREWNYNTNIVIPNNTKYIQFTSGRFGGGYIKLKEIAVANEPTMSVTKYYPTIKSTGIERAYDIVRISYNSTSIQKQYRIGSGEWKNYEGVGIKLSTGQVIYARGIDKNGKATRIVSSYTSTIPSDALPTTAYDNNANTYISINHPNSDGRTSKKIYVDSSMWGRNVNIKAYIWSDYAGDYYSNYIYFCNSSGTSLKTLKFQGASAGTPTYREWNYNTNIVIPNNTKYIQFTSGRYGEGYINLKEIKPI